GKIIMEHLFLVKIYGVGVSDGTSNGVGVVVKKGSTKGVGVDVSTTVASPVIKICQAISKSPAATTGNCGKLPNAKSKRAITSLNKASFVSVCNSNSTSRAFCTSSFAKPKL